MNTLKIALLIIGFVLLLFGLYTAFIPKEVIDIGDVVEVSAKEGMSGSAMAMITIGICLIGAALIIKPKK